MTRNEQLTKWVEGTSIHNDELDECCPDFSCCQPYFHADKEARETFFRAIENGDDSTKMEMLGMFLGQALSAASSDKKVYISGIDDPVDNVRQ